MPKSLVRGGRGQFAGTSASLLAVYALTAVQGAVLARVLGPEARGELAVVMFYAQLLTNVGLLGGPLALARRAAKDPSGAAVARIQAVRLGLLTGLGSAGIAAALYLLALPAGKQHLCWWGLLFTLTVPLEHVRLNLLGTDHGAGRFFHYNVNRLLAVGGLLTLIALSYAAGRRTVSDLVIVSIVGAAGSLAAWLIACKGSRFGRDSLALSSLLRESAPLGAATVVSEVYLRLDVALMQWWAPLGIQGYYSSALAAATALTIVPHAVSLFVFNAGARSGAEDVRALPRIVWAAAGFQVVSAIVFYQAVAFLVPLVFGTEFLGAVPFVRALIPAYALNGIASVLESYLRGAGKPLQGLVARGAASGVMVIGCAALFPRIGPLGVPIGASMAAAFNAGVTALAAWNTWTASRDSVGGGARSSAARGEVSR